MTTFTIDTENNITAFAHPHEADAVIGSGQTFTSPEELTDLASGWPAERLVDVGTRLLASPDLARTSSRLRSSRTGRRRWRGSGRPLRD